ncbi:XdhC family protein [Archangium primigenium]|uniref:XdhC family protein n=1 Tax=[Archangium] primigenium TaxID=2792470 RepID=UPI001959BBA5|nr:XdhC/CoxI family protein [Archangium primigenium]MBM7112310.1 XdhC family protein [Archangium primigenium]
MRELSEILTAWRSARNSAEPLILATIVRVEGSTYRRPGARMLMTGERQLAGGISGGCLESDVLRKALWRTAQGESVVIQYDSRADDEFAFTMGLGCNGLVELLLERLDPARPQVLDFLARGQEERVAVAVATVVVAAEGRERVGARVMLDARGRLEATVEDAALRDVLREDLERVLAGGRAGYVRRETAARVVEVALEVVQPPVPLLIFGTGVDVVPVVDLAKTVGWHVTVVGTRPAGNLRLRFPRADAWVASRLDKALAGLTLDARTLALLMTHNYPEDEAVLAPLIASPVRYIGVLGPRRRTERLLAGPTVRDARPTAEQLARVYGPMGLDIGAEGGDEIALSIVAELQAFLSGRPGGALRERTTPIHPEPEQSTPRSLPLPEENVLPVSCALTAAS